MNPNIETFIGCESSYEEAEIVLFGAPFDSTTSFRPGARFGSAAMRHESFGLETYSPYQDMYFLEKCIGRNRVIFFKKDLAPSAHRADRKMDLLPKQEVRAHHTSTKNDRFLFSDVFSRH